MTGKMEDFIYKLNEFGQYDFELEEDSDENVQQTTEQDIIILPTTRELK